MSIERSGSAQSKTLQKKNIDEDNEVNQGIGLLNLMFRSNTMELANLNEEAI